MEECRYDSDHEIVFRQESYFNWVFGVKVCMSTHVALFPLCGKTIPSVFGATFARCPSTWFLDFLLRYPHGWWQEPGCYGVIDARSGHATLFVPRFGWEYGVWCGKCAQRPKTRRRFIGSSPHRPHAAAPK